MQLRVTIASLPGPAQFPSLAVQKSGEGPGIIHHVRDVEDEEKGERT